MSTGIHQVLAGSAPRDAITHHALEARHVIREMGLRSEILVADDRVHPALRAELRAHTAWDSVARQGDVAILHYSIASPAFEWVLERAERAALHYHNVTPAALLWRDAPLVALECALGRRALGDLVGRVAAVAADSEFNAAELLEIGFGEAAVIGVMRAPLGSALRRPRPAGSPPRLLFVGRGAPNKAQHDLILALAALAQAGVHAELWLAGTWEGFEPYEARCRALARRVGVEDRMVLTGSLSEAELAQTYADADCFVCLSDHEGFCVPVLEAIEMGLPIVAFAAGAVPESVGRAGLLLDQKPPSLVAEAVVEALGNARLAAWMATGRQEQLARFSPEALADRLRAFVEPLM
jgi:glycosyltransferase involved in cell wall biosynthesis